MDDGRATSVATRRSCAARKLMLAVGAFAALLPLLAACGQKGDLVLPSAAPASAASAGAR